MKKVLLFWFVLVLVTGGVFATPQAETAGGKVTLRIAHSMGEGDSAAGPYFVPLLRQWAEENSDRVELLEETTARSDDMATKLYVQMAGGELPDVMGLVGGGARLGPLVDGGALLDFDIYLDETDAISRSDIMQSAWDLYTIDGTLYGLPISQYVAGFFCNSALFDEYGLEYPETYEDMVRVGKVFQDNGIVPFAVGSVQGNPSHFWFSEVQAQFPGGLEAIEALPQSMNFNDAVTLKTVELMIDMKNNGLFPDDTMANGGWGPSFALYNEQKAAMIYTYPWMLGSASDEMVELSVPIAVPKMPGWVKDPATFINAGAVYGFLVNKDSYNDAAKHDMLIELVDFLGSDEMFNARTKGGLIPTKINNMDLGALPPLTQKLLAFTADMTGVTCHFWNISDTEANNAFMYGLDELWAGTTDAQGFLDKVQEALDSAE